MVELFTSQGCSSCRSAAKVFADVAAMPGVVALAYHVDYWDYIGWRDTYGSRANTDRQRAYAKSLATGTIYTPQMIVNGQTDVIGTHGDEVRAALAKGKGGTNAEAGSSATKAPATTPSPGNVQTAAASAEVTLSADASRLHIMANASPGMAGSPQPVLVLVTFDTRTTTIVERGENKGVAFVNVNPVRDWRVIGMWAGKPLEVDIPLSSLKRGAGTAQGCAAVLQVLEADGTPGPILAAAMLKF